MNRTVLKKSIAIFLMLITIGNAIAPTVSWALTSGPTAPEATSFEPVDTTDMVNTITGDLAYNIPLLEVPGPAGSYPLSLSYHSGIQPNMDASWVGLGWTLNPGSISRLTNGLPDDMNGAQSTERTFWEGGSRTIDTYGVSVGIGNVATVGAGLSFAQDTYKGRGVGGYVSVGANISNTPLNVSASANISPYGGGTSYGVGVGVVAGSELNVSANVGLTFNSSGGISAGLSGGVGLGVQKNPKGAAWGGSLLGASISSSGGGVSMSVGGFDGSAHNSKEGKISTSTNDFQVDIPVYYGINVHIGHTYIRYWMDETESYHNYGSLFFPNADPGDLSTQLYDAYHMQSMSSLTTGDNPEKYMAGSFADYDQYSVNAQGLAGNIRPYHYLASLYSQDIVNNVNNTKQILGYTLPQPSPGVRYNFTNDFSNRVIYNAPDIQVNHNGHLLDFPYASAITGIEQGQPRYLPYVPGSKHVEYFTTEQIVSSKLECQSRGFLECTSAGFTRSIGASNMTGKVEAFSITNSSGVTYHFSLPAYAYNESVWSLNKDDRDKLSFNKLSQKGKYAYTWYLTGVTGPDYVDRGSNGLPDGVINDFDWGYWVDFQYGRWVDNYRWRNPSEGFNTDLDNGFQAFSKGMKEVYYLNAIKTKTHTALFVKELRADGKGETPMFESDEYEFAVAYSDQGIQKKYWIDSGRFVPGKKYYGLTNCSGALCPIYYEGFPASSMKLKSILMFNNKDITNFSDYYNSSPNYSYSFNYSSNIGQEPITFQVHHGENVLDVFDIQSASFPINKALREIDFSHDYSLTPATPNSFDPSGNIYHCSNCNNFYPPSSLSATKLGKLTLNSLTFKGKGGQSLVPPMNFYYDYRSPLIFGGTIRAIDMTTNVASFSTLDVSFFSIDANQFSIGDLIKFSQQSKTYYGFVKDITTYNIFVKINSSALPVVGLVNGFQKTKNPEYNKDLYDMWGLYKSDFQTMGVHNLERLTTPISAQNTDAWSLREIESSLGGTIKIQYESDTYSKSIFNQNLSLPLTQSTNYTDVTPIPKGGIYPLYMEASSDPNSSIELDKLYSVGDEVQAAILGEFCVPITDPDGVFLAWGPCASWPYTTAVVQEVTRNKIRVRSVVPPTLSSLELQNTYMHFIGGVLQVKGSNITYGGGLRVASIGAYDGIQDQTRFTTYKYEFNQQSSGVTSYEPVNIAPYKISNIAPYNKINNYQSDFNKMYYAPHLQVLSMARELPAPAVYYGKVRLGEKIVDNNGVTRVLPGYTEYEFESLDADMIGIESGPISNTPSTGTHRSQTYQTISTGKVTIKDFLQRMGQLKSIANYNEQGVKITETINHYLHDQQTGTSFSANSNEYIGLTNQFNNQGVIQETFNHARWVNTTANNVSSAALQGLISKKESYPVVQTGTSSINYKSGIKTETKNLAFDFYNGNVTQSLFSDGYGNNYLTTTVPAYHYYPHMGLKMPYLYENIPDQTFNKHMIDQVAYTKTVKVSTDPLKSGIVSASAQTWSSNIDVLGVDPLLNSNDIWRKLETEVWRKQASFSFVGDDDNVQLHTDGLYPLSSFTDFDTWYKGPPVPGVWQKNAEITLYDIYSHALEASDINGNYAATRMTMDQTKVSATAANCQYNEIGYTGAEEAPVATSESSPYINFPTLYDFGGGILGTTNQISPGAHTGKGSILVQPGSKGFIYFPSPPNAYHVPNTYHVSFWSTASDAVIKYELDGVHIQSAITKNKGKAGDWYLLEADIAVTTNYNVALWCEAGSSQANFDDFRVHPLNSSMTSYVYNEWGELSHILNANNLFTNYNYDDMGRLTRTYQESFQTNYGNMGIVFANMTYYNHAKPAMATLTASKIGASGQIVPEGSVSVKIGSSYTFQLLETCPSQKLERVSVDNQWIDFNQGKTLLIDGTEVTVYGGGVTLSKIGSSHTITAVYDDIKLGYAVCNTDSYGNSDGTINYYLYDMCGVLGPVHNVRSLDEVPVALMEYVAVPEGGCPYD